MLAIILGCLFAVLLIIIYYSSKKETFAVSRFDGKTYNTLDNFENEEAAADTLAKINKKNETLIKFLLTKYKPGTPGYTIAERLRKNYNRESLTEHWPKNSSETAYVEDKGVVFALCLRDKNRDKRLLHDINTVTFVALHELSHIASVSYDHGDEFWTNFKFILLNAVEIGIYSPVDYSINSINYCSLQVDYNPLFDDSLDVDFY